VIHGLVPPSERTADRPALAVHLASLALAGAVLLYLGRDFWFHYDEWDIVGNHSLGLFQPHNEHWSTLPYLVYRALYPIFGLRQYLPYLAVVVILHLGVAHLAWRVMRHEGLGDWLATGVAGAFLVLGAGSENLVWAWQMGFVGSVCLGYLAVVLAAGERASRRRDAIATAAAGAALMCSGIGMVMLFVAATAIGLRRGWRRALVVVGPALVLFVAWYLAFGRHAGPRTYAAPTAGGSLAFLWTGLTVTAEMATGLRFLGPLMVLGAVGWAAWKLRRRSAGSELALAGVLGAVALFLLISLGRLQYGTDSARQGRYLYVAAALLLPVFALGLQRLAGSGRLGAGLAALLVVWAGVHGARVLVLAERQHGAVTAHTRQLVLAAAARLDGGQGAGAGPVPDPVAAPTLTLGRIAGFKKDGSLPSG
jgi:hypothetical protein